MYMLVVWGFDTAKCLSSCVYYKRLRISSFKILERAILNRCSVQLRTGHHQFGFKEHHSTDMAIYALKEITDYYLRNGSPVFRYMLSRRAEGV